MSNITLYEKIDRQRLQQVLECDNIPFENDDDPEWKDIFLKQLKIYSTKREKKDKGIPINYDRSNQYGRYTSKGLQLFQKDVRMFITNNKYIDLDFSNCHIVILNKLLKEHNRKLTSTEYVKSDGKSLLQECVDDRKKYLEKNKTTKHNMLTNLFKDTNKYMFFKDAHNQIYKEFLPELKKENKTLYNRVKKNRDKANKSYNYDGAFLALYLQNIENELLQVLYNTLIEKGFIVGCLIFDGLLVEKTMVDEEEIKNVISEVEIKIKKEKGYDIKIVLKNTNTDWIPIKGDNCLLKEKEKLLDKDFGEKFSKETARSFFDDSKNPKIIEGRFSEFMDYMNRFCCQFDEPNSYGFRNYEKTKFKFRSLSTLRDRIGLNVINTWNMSDKLLNFISPNFIVDDTKNDNRYYNQYIRPKMIEHQDTLTKDYPVLFEYLLKIVCDNDKRLFDWTLDYITTLIKKGRTNHGLVLMGGKGLGKSFFMEFLTLLVGEDYSMPINDINKLTNHFNKWMENTILIKIEEVCPNAGEYMKLQNILKTLITESQMEITPKGLDSYNIESYTNPIIATNFHNPVQATDDNRRFVFYEFSNKRKCDTKFFSLLEKQIKDNIEKLRFYFYHRNVCDLSETRPITKKEKEVIDINLNITERFIKQQYFVKGKEDDNSRLYSNFINQYKEFCRENEEKASIPKYITPILKSCGFEMKTINRKVYIQGKSFVKCDKALEDENDKNTELDDDL